MKHLFFIVLLLCCPVSMFAIEYPMVHYTQADGLPGNTVYDIFQDEDRYIWFATNAGVARFNGLKFEHFSTNDGLPDNECFFFRKDHLGRLWIATYNGELVYYKDHIFHTARNTPFLRIAPRLPHLMNIRIEQDSSITFHAANAQVCLSVKGNTCTLISIPGLLKQIDSPAHLQPTDVTDIKRYGQYTELIIGTDMAVFNAANRLIRTQHISQLPMIWGFSDPVHEYYFSGNKIYNDDLKIYKELPGELIARYSINRVCDYDNYIFIATTRGLWINNQLILGNQNISDVYKDFDGNYWIATLGNGVYRMNADSRNCIFYRNAYHSRVIYADKQADGLSFGTFNRNIYRINDTGVQCLFNCEALKKYELKNEKSATYYDSNYLASFGEWKDYIISKKDGRISDHSYTFSSAVSGTLYKAPYLFLFGNSGIDFLRYNDWLHKKRQVKATPVSIPGKNMGALVYGFARSYDGGIWVSSSNTISRFTDTVLVPQEQFHNPSFREIIFTRQALIGYTLDNRLLIVSNYNGPSITIDSSFHNDGVWNKFYCLTDSSVILSSNHSYKLITTGTRNGKVFSTMKNLEHTAVPPLAEYIYSDGFFCYFFKDQSITKIPLSNLLMVPRAPVVQFRDINTGDTTMSINEVMQLSYSLSRNIGITFSVVSFETPELEYEYSITSEPDHQLQWLQSKNEVINLFNIKSGTYQVQVRPKLLAAFIVIQPGLH